MVLAALREILNGSPLPQAAMPGAAKRTLTPARLLTLAAVSLFVVSCNNTSYVQSNTPNKAYQDYKLENRNNASVIGVGEPISSRQMTANATLSLTGQYDVEQVLQKIAGTYNVAIRWGNGARKGKRKDVMINNLTFDEARNYIEDVYDIQIIKEGERRLLILPSASEPRLASFSPGNNVTLSQAIRGLAEQCNYNLVIAENKEKLNLIRVTSNLKDVTCYDAFEALLNPHGLSLVNAGDYVTIGGLPQRQWTVNLYEPERSEETTVDYASDFSSDSSGGESSDSGSSGGSAGSQSAGGSNKITVKYERNLWQDLEDDLNQLITSNCPSELDADTVDLSAPVSAVQLLPPPVAAGGQAGGSAQTLSPGPLKPTPVPSASASSGGAVDKSASCGYVRINKSVGLIQMRAPRNVLDEANDIIQRVEEIASRRILLEARVLAVSRTRNFDQQGRLQVGGRQNDTALSGSFIGSVTAALTRDLATFTGANLSTIGGVSAKSANLDAVMGLLEQYGTTYELMHPMMELMDRQRATLIDGRNEKYFVVQSTTTTSTATSTASDVEERNQFLGLQFSATAQVADNAGDPHTIALQIPITSLAKTVNIPSGTSGTVAGVAPVANTRLIDQKVRVRDGEIKVIGGLTKTVAIDNESGLPIVRDIPALGKLANEQSITFEEVEFVVLLQVKRLN